MEFKHSKGVWTYGKHAIGNYYVQSDHGTISEIVNEEADARLFSQANSLLDLICKNYVDYLVNMPSEKRNSAEGQNILCSMRDQICDATGFDNQAVQDHFESVALKAKMEKGEM